MRVEDLAQQRDAAHAIYQAAQAKLAKVSAEEQRLRGLLAKLAHDEKIGRTVLETDSAFRAIQGDQVWNQWVGTNRAALNRQLALVMVRKETATQEVQAAFGKADVLEKLTTEAKWRRRKRREATALDEAMELRLLRR